MRFKIGQSIKVKDFNDLKTTYPKSNDGSLIVDSCFFLREMKVYCGEEYKIKTIVSNGVYELDLADGGNWYFTEGMLEDINTADTTKKHEETKIGVVGSDKPKRTYTRKK